jgi:hypothetical protein
MGRGQNSAVEEILFGGGAMAPREELGPPPPPMPAGDLTDADILQLFADGRLDRCLDPAYSAGALSKFKLIAVSALLVNYSENNREYQGAIGIGIDPQTQQPVFAGITAHGKSGRVGSLGKAVYKGPSIDAACNAVNEMLDKKVRKGYTAQAIGSPWLRGGDVHRELEAKLRS